MKPNTRYPLLAFLCCMFTLGLIAQPPGDSTRRLRLIFAGDIMGHESQIRAAEIERDKFFDYSPCFEWVAPLLKSADLAIGNLELTLPGKPPYSGYPQFRSPDDLALALRHAGFNFLLTANNHSNDAGKDGVINTLNTLDHYGFYRTGTFRDAFERQAFYPLVIYRNNFKLVFLNYTYDTNGIPTRPPTIVNEIDEALIEQDMAVARQLQPDLIVVIMHWGDEYQRQENEKQRRLARQLIGWGADLIIGSHPHVVQPIKWESAPGPDGLTKRVLCAYSLGNFVSGQVKPHTDGGIMVAVNLEKPYAGGKASVTDYQYIPVWRHIQRHPNGKRTYRVLPVSLVEQDPSLVPGFTNADKEAMSRFAKNTREHLGADSEFALTPERFAPPIPQNGK